MAGKEKMLPAVEKNQGIMDCSVLVVEMVGEVEMVGAGSGIVSCMEL